MPFIILYFIKLSISLSVVFLFYHFILQKLTFYIANRWYLLGYTLLSFVIPFINISPVLERNSWSSTGVIAWVPVITGTPGTAGPAASGNMISAWAIIMFLVIAGMLFMLIRMLLQLFSFRRLKRNATAIINGGMNLYQVNENIIPFSFGNSIFINRHLHSENELQEIIRHEFVHVKQRHSFDIIWGELLCLICWYNPFAWLLKKSIRQNLEFIADSKVLQNGFNKKQYQYLLLKVIGNNQFSIAPKFNFSSLKKRIAMMNKMKSAAVHLVKFLFILPLIAVILVAFRGQGSDRVLVKNTRPAGRILTKSPESRSVFAKDTVPDELLPNNKGYFIDLIGDTKMSKVVMKGRDNNEYSNYVFENKDKCIVVVKDKDKQEVIRLSLTQWSQKEKYYQDKYGDLPKPRLAGTPEAQANGDEINLWAISNDYEITDKKAVIKLKNGTTEHYDLTNKEERSAFEKKYGKIIQVNVNTNSSLNTVITPIAVATNYSVKATVSPTVSVNTAISPVAVSSSTGTTVIAAVTPVPGEGVNTINDYGYRITGKEDVLITITKNTSPEQLEDFKKKMKEKGVELSFTETDYEQGILKAISGTMKSGGSQSNFSATDFNKLILAMIKDGERTYFKVSVKDDKEVI